MSKIEELYEEAKKNPELTGAFVEAVQQNQVEGFLKEHDCSASPGEVQAFLAERMNQIGELSDEELDTVAGGKDNPDCQPVDPNLRTCVQCNDTYDRSKFSKCPRCGNTASVAYRYFKFK